MAKMWIVEDYNNGNHYLFETEDEAKLAVIRAYINYFDKNTPDAKKLRENTTPMEIMDDLENILTGGLWDSVSIYDVQVGGEVVLRYI